MHCELEPRPVLRDTLPVFIKGAEQNAACHVTLTLQNWVFTAQNIIVYINIRICEKLGCIHDAYS